MATVVTKIAKSRLHIRMSGSDMIPVQPRLVGVDDLVDVRLDGVHVHRLYVGMRLNIAMGRRKLTVAMRCTRVDVCRRTQIGMSAGSSVDVGVRGYVDMGAGDITMGRHVSIAVRKSQSGVGMRTTSSVDVAEPRYIAMQFGLHIAMHTRRLVDMCGCGLVEVRPGNIAMTDSNVAVQHTIAMSPDHQIAMRNEYCVAVQLG